MTQLQLASDEQPPEPAARMTVKVYAVDPRTRERRLVRTTAVAGKGPLPVMGVPIAYPKCECARCAASREEER